MLAYSTDFTGSTNAAALPRISSRRMLLGETAERVTSVAWGNDNKTVFYVTEDATTKRSIACSPHGMGSSKPAEELFNEKDESTASAWKATRSKGYVMLVSEVRKPTRPGCIDAEQTPRKVRAVPAAQKRKREGQRRHAGDSFFIVTNDKGRNYRLVTAPVGKTTRSGRKSSRTARM